MPDTQPLSIFFSYAHEDERLFRRLLQHLSALRRQSLIRVWHDRCIVPGDEWASVIDKNLEAADIVVLFVSASFVDSDYCWGIEMACAMERHAAGEARVIPVIARPVDFGGTPFAQLQCLPRDARPVTSWPVRDEAFANISSGVRKVAAEFQKNRELEYMARQASRCAQLTPIERDVAQFVGEHPQDPDVHLLRALDEGRWVGKDAVIVAAQIKQLMVASGKWRTAYSGTNRVQIKKHERTVRVSQYLESASAADDAASAR